MIGLICFIHVRASYFNLHIFIVYSSLKKPFSGYFHIVNSDCLPECSELFWKKKITFLCPPGNVSEAGREEKLPWMSGVGGCGWRCLVGTGRASGMWWEGSEGFPRHEGAGREVRIIHSVDEQLWAGHPIYNKTRS